LLAAIAYNIKAKELYKEFANLNDISENDFEKNYDTVVKIMNNIKKRNNISLFIGVSKQNKSNNFMSNITKNKKKSYLGTYETEIEAAIAYNIISKKLNEKKAKLNIISDEDNEKHYNTVLKEMERLKVI
jgi:hypothetical protein